jgi:hypothetical protein
MAYLSFGFNDQDQRGWTPRPAADPTAFGGSGTPPPPAPSMNAGVLQSMQAPSAPKPSKGTGWVNPQTYLSLNRGAGEQMAGVVGQGLADSRLSGSRATAESRAAGESAHNANISAAQSGSVGTLLQNAYGKSGNYTSGQRGLDSFLTRSAGPTLENATKQYEQWLGYLPPPPGGTGTGVPPPPTDSGTSSGGTATTTSDPSAFIDTPWQPAPGGQYDWNSPGWVTPVWDPNTPAADQPLFDPITHEYLPMKGL